MKKYTTFKIGGPAEYFAEPRNPHELKLLISAAKRYNIHISVIGSGSNILISDKGIKGILLRLNSPVFRKIYFCDNCIYASAGAALNAILKFAYREGLSGLEFLAGIPGTLGGALAMNAGIPARSIGDLVADVEVMDYNGNIKTLDKSTAKFTYRNSSLSRYIILGAHLKLSRKGRNNIEKEISNCLAYRRSTQDYSYPSAGCIFKNPKKYSAGRLIDLCGLKGKKFGGACISKLHANFILNLGGASSTDVLRLMNVARRKVKDKFSIILEPEIKIWQ